MKQKDEMNETQIEGKNAGCARICNIKYVTYGRHSRCRFNVVVAAEGDDRNDPNNDVHIELITDFAKEAKKWVTAISSVLDTERLKVYGPGHWKIVVYAGRSLIAADITGTSDPYIVVKSTSATGLGKVPEEGRSPHVASTLYPDFKSWTLIFGGTADGTLIIDVMDKDRGSRDDYLGQLNVHVLPHVGISANSIGITRGRSYRSWLPLRGKTIDDTTARGELDIELTYISEQKEDGITASFAIPEKKLAPRQSAIIAYTSATTPRGSAMNITPLQHTGAAAASVGSNGQSRGSSSNNGPTASTSRISPSSLASHPPSSPRGSSSVTIPPGLVLPPGAILGVDTGVYDSRGGLLGHIIFKPMAASSRGSSSAASISPSAASSPSLSSSQPSFGLPIPSGLAIPSRGVLMADGAVYDHITFMKLGHVNLPSSSTPIAAPPLSSLPVARASDASPATTPRSSLVAVTNNTPTTAAAAATSTILSSSSSSSSPAAAVTSPVVVRASSITPRGPSRVPPPAPPRT